MTIHGSPETYRGLADRTDAAESRYIRARALLDGSDVNAQRLVKAARDMIRAGLAGVDTGDFLDWALEVSSDLTRLSLNAFAWLALEDGRWAPARALAGEVVARDHHDLLAQRIIDAAEGQSTSIELEVDRWLATRTCEAPWRQIETRTNGTVHMCCSAWQPVGIGALDKGTAAFWNSDRAQEIRRSVREGDFSYCSRWHCPQIAGRRLPARDEVPIEAEPLEMEAGPKRVILSHDRSCNISCPSCRTDLITLPHKASDRLDRLYDERLDPLVADADWVKVTGSGDPFGSRHFRHVLKRLTAEGPPRKRIQLHTNGLLANARAWADLKLTGNVASVWVSIDAARAETYSVLRRGGDFDALVENLRFLGERRAAGDVDLFRLDFVVQQMNYAEMPAFVDLAREVGADGVYFLRLRNWGHFEADAFREMDVCSSAHPEHGKLLDILADPRVRDPMVELGSMSDLVARAVGMAAE